jgi:hypothetical protein
MNQQSVEARPGTQHSEAPPVRDIPIWLTLLILLLCIGGGGWVVWKYTNTNPPEPITIAPGHPRAALVKNWRPSEDGGGGGPSRGPRKNQDDDSDGVKSLTPNRSWRVRAGNAYMFVNVGRKGDLEISPNYRSIYTPEQNQLVIMRQRLLQDEAMREFIKVAPDQLAKLKNVPAPEGMKMGADEKKKLDELFQAYRNAKDSKAQEAAEKSLVSALDEVGKKRFEETKAYMVKRVEAIQSALTPDQIKLFNEGANRAAAAPTPPAPAALKPRAETKVAAAAPAAPTTAPTTKPAAAAAAAPR